MLNNERFMVPEVLFQPSDIGLQQVGLAQTVVDAVETAHPDLHALLYSNVVCTGGSAKCPGFRERLYNELRPLVPDDIEVACCSLHLLWNMSLQHHAQDLDAGRLFWVLGNRTRTDMVDANSHGLPPSTNETCLIHLLIA